MRTFIKSILKFFVIILLLSFANHTVAQDMEFEQTIIGKKEVNPRILGDEDYIRHKPNPKDTVKNKFYADKKFLKLAIPITDIDLYADEKRIFNVSSRNINALLVVIDGNNGKETPLTPVINHIECRIPFKSIKKKGLQFRSRLKRDDKMLIIVVHDDIVGKKEFTKYCYLKYIKDKVSNYKDYDDVRKNWYLDLKSYSCGDELNGLIDDKPKEDDGDVIGGNG